jgi:sugar phosphate isomerase/epimerase
MSYGPVLNGHSAEKTINNTAKWVDLAARIGAPVMRTQVVGITKAGLMPTEEVVEALQPAISRSADYAASKGVKLAVETHGWSWARVPEHIAALTKAVDSDYFGILLHTWPGEAERIIKLAGNKIFHLHLCESDMIGLVHAFVHSPWFQDAGWTDDNYAEKFGISLEEVQAARKYDPSKAGHYFMGDGEVDFKGVIQALRDAHYAGWWNYEGHLMEEPGAEEEARRAYEYLKPLLA